MTPITWRGLTADYAPHERVFLRALTGSYPDEAQIVHELKARLGGVIHDVMCGVTYVYSWGNNSRRAELKGRRCVIVAEGTKRTVLVRFLDNGEKVTTSRRALRKAAA